jgi:hypothetical protein
VNVFTCANPPSPRLMLVGFAKYTCSTSGGAGWEVRVGTVAPVTCTSVGPTQYSWLVVLVTRVSVQAKQAHLSQYLLLRAILRSALC